MTDKILLFCIVVAAILILKKFAGFAIKITAIIIALALVYMVYTHGLSLP